MLSPSSPSPTPFPKIPFGFAYSLCMSGNSDPLSPSLRNMCIHPSVSPGFTRTTRRDLCQPSTAIDGANHWDHLHLHSKYLDPCVRKEVHCSTPNTGTPMLDSEISKQID